MPGIRCALYGCNNSFYTTKTENIVFHTFPKRKDIRSEWIRICKRQDAFNPDTSRICSVHFVEDDYERDLRNELLGLPLKKRLKKTAVPTEGINIKKATLEANSAYSKRFLTRKRIQEVAELTSDLLSKSNMVNSKTDNSQTDYTSTPVDNLSETHNDNLTETHNRELIYEKKYKELLKKYRKLHSSYKSLRNNLRYYKTKHYSKFIKSEVASSALLKKVLAENQIALLSNKRK